MTKKNVPAAIESQIGDRLPISENQISNRSDICSESELQELCATFGVDADASIEKLQEDAVSDINHGTRLILRGGVSLLAIKGRCAHGEYLDALGVLDIDPRRAAESTRLALCYVRLPVSQRRHVLTGHKTKALMLASLNQEELDLVVNGDGLDDLMRLPKSQLAREIRSLKAAAANEKAENERADLKAESEAIKQAELDKKSGFPAWLRNIRTGVMAECEGMHERLDVIDNLVLTSLLPQIGDSADDARLREAGAVTALQAIHAVMARAARLYNAAAEAHPDGALDEANPLARMSDAEISMALAARKNLFDEAGYQRRLREHQQISEKPRGRGRPSNASKAPVKPSKKKG